ncbi:MAG: histidine--tRNA ligase [Chitinophagaceae bacterium]|nr:MAG: histidine--tRNA ligase [Chitinophagaceae bacterium]
MSKPSIPQGTRDFDAITIRKRQHIFNTIKTVFELYGVEPLETPAMENIETLMGKYGEEGDKLIFKILNNGLDNPNKLEKIQTGFQKVLEGKSSADITERALRYDLTIPFARYVAMNHQQLAMPFKRYQMQPVWRADRPQKGRYREFYQCDADVVGSQSLWNEVELTHIYNTVFEKLKLPVQILINNRKILQALAILCGGAHLMTDITVAIDKLDKIGLDKVVEELRTKQLNDAQIEIIKTYLSIEGNNESKINILKTLFKDNEMGLLGISELEFLLLKMNGVFKNNELVVSPTLARGLNYYTGTIFEVKAINAQMGSIGGGGRYDDLTGLFGVKDIPGVGISFGVDRIYDVLTEKNLFPADIHHATQILFFNLGEKEAERSFELMQELRACGIKAELYHTNVKMDKQFKYAEKKNIAHIAILGSNELAENKIVIKNLLKSEQIKIDFSELINYKF